MHDSIEPASNAAFAAEIRLDRSLNVVSEDMGFNVSLK